MSKMGVPDSVYGGHDRVGGGELREIPGGTTPSNQQKKDRGWGYGKETLRPSNWGGRGERQECPNLLALRKRRRGRERKRRVILNWHEV